MVRERRNLSGSRIALYLPLICLAGSLIPSVYLELLEHNWDRTFITEGIKMKSSVVAFVLTLALLAGSIACAMDPVEINSASNVFSPYPGVYYYNIGVQGLAPYNQGAQSTITTFLEYRRDDGQTVEVQLDTQLEYPGYYAFGLYGTMPSNWAGPPWSPKAIAQLETVDEGYLAEKVLPVP